ncbi:hypothetical protein DPEC_G00210500 [Dallia pectoralis]|uniref:Uncharacterized protein n=1 Tax=Dallia pectoralis TaxID=75939 RepID=A0ACC2G5U4_DALPE|nr:hypothetical protein DPEC_G00210500 [Dallia pectoralis]
MQNADGDIMFQMLDILTPERGWLFAAPDGKGHGFTRSRVARGRAVSGAGGNGELSFTETQAGREALRGPLWHYGLVIAAPPIISALPPLSQPTELQSTASHTLTRSGAWADYIQEGQRGMSGAESPDDDPGRNKCYPRAPSSPISPARRHGTCSYRNNGILWQRERPATAVEPVGLWGNVCLNPRILPVERLICEQLPYPDRDDARRIQIN